MGSRKEAAIGYSKKGMIIAYCSDLDSGKRQSQHIENSVMETYLRNVTEFTVDEKFWLMDNGGYSDDSMISMIRGRVKRILRNHDKDDRYANTDILDATACKVYSEDHSMYLIFGETKDESGNKSLHIATYEFLSKPECMIYRRFVFEGERFHEREDLMVIIDPNGSRSHNCRQMAEIHINDMNHLRIIYEAAYMFCKAIDEKTIDQSFHHIPAELDIYRWIWNSGYKTDNKDLDAYMVTNAYRWYLGDKHIVRGQNVYDFNYDAMGELIRLIPQSNIPICDLSGKEWDYIIGYCRRNNLLYSDTSPSVNLIDRLSNPRYGLTYRDVFQDPEGIEDDVGYLSTVYLDEKMGFLRVSILVKLLQDNGVEVYALSTVDCRNLENFNHFEDTFNISTFFIFKPENRSSFWMPATREEVEELLPAALQDPHRIHYITMNTLAFHIVMHDRPERTLMLNESKMVEDEQPTENVPKRHLTKRQKRRLEKFGPSTTETKKPADDKIVVKRILKTKKDAKEYVERMTGTRRDAVHTIESWTRAAHIRHLKNGVEIQIGETTCNRHLPLSTDAEVHIKL